MAPRKLSAKEVEDLAKIAQSDFENPPQELPGHQEYSDVEDFIVTLDIMEGEGKIFTWNVWDLYVKWSENEPVLKRRQFGSEFKKHFKQINESGDSRYYRLDPKPFDISFEVYLNKIAQDNREKRAKRLYEKNRQAFRDNYNRTLKDITDARKKEKKRRIAREKRAARRAASECPPEGEMGTS
jgi:hypothetical protein